MLDDFFYNDLYLKSVSAKWRNVLVFVIKAFHINIKMWFCIMHIMFNISLINLKLSGKFFIYLNRNEAIEQILKKSFI